jgi:hypothetical protein
MKIKLKTLKQDNYEVEVDDMGITIQAFKQILQEKLDIDGKKLKLLYNGSILENNLTLNDIGINEEVSLVMMNIQKPDKEPVRANDIKEEEKVCHADIKVDDIPHVVASIMKIMCKKNPEESQRYFDELKANNPAIMHVLKKEEAKFKNFLYSPITKDNNKIFKDFYNGKDMNSYLTGVEEEQVVNKINPDIENLIAMGYTRQQAEEAYFICESNFDLALNYLLDNN